MGLVGMSIERLRHLFNVYRECMVHLAVETPKGDERSGSAFHAGDNWLVTARHCIAENKLLSATAETRRRSLGGDDHLRIEQIILASDEAVDLALLKVEEFPTRSHIGIGGHLDDWFSGEEFYLTRVLLMGYPPIPTSHSPFLVVTAGEVNAVIDRYIEPRHPYFIISCMSRGGFSGGPVISEDGDIFGVMVDSLLNDPTMAHELGWTGVLTVEPLWNLLHENGVYPGDNALFLRAVYDHDEEAMQQMLRGVVRGEESSQPST